ncbi:MAG: thioesterase family protein [Desulfobacterota bacterium]|nr:thioesterase family protein [Thermodesulfobacteriota bacterium]
MTPFHVGMTRELVVETGAEHTAQFFYKNLPRVLATPFLAGFMERVCAELIDEHLEPGEQSVGAFMQLKHTAPTPLGMSVRITARLTSIDGSKLTFALEAFDEVEKIGEAVHERFIIKTEKFAARVAKKATALHGP